MLKRVENKRNKNFIIQSTKLLFPLIINASIALENPSNRNNPSKVKITDSFPFLGITPGQNSLAFKISLFKRI